MPLSAIIILLGPSCASPPSLEILSAANRAAQESIRSIHVKVAYDYLPDASGPPPPTYRAEYWRTPDAIRVREWFPDEQNEFVIKNGVSDKICTLFPSPNERRVSIVRSKLQDTVVIINVCEMGLLQSNKEMTYDLIQKSGSRVSEEAETGSGRTCYLVRVPDKGYHREVWLDPGFNNLARRIDMVFDDGARIERSVKEFREFSPGVYFPVQLIRRAVPSAIKPGDKGSIQDIRFDVISLNQPIPREVFQLTYPRGVIMSDELKQLYYPVDESGRAAGPSRPLVSAIAPASEPPVGRATPNSEAGVKNIVYWLLCAGFAVVAFITYVRRRNHG